MQSETEPIDTTLVTQSLQKVAKGAGIVFVGSIVGIFLNFINRIFIARNYTQNEYGIFSLAFTILNVFALIGALGLHEGAARQIAYYRGKEDNRKIMEIVIYSLLFGSCASIILFFLLYSVAGFLSSKIFNMSDLTFPLRSFSAAIPFSVSIYLLTAIFRGFGSVKEKIIFNDFLKNLLFFLFLGYILYADLSFQSVILSYFLALVISASLFISYFILQNPLPITSNEGIYLSAKVGKELLIFSLPLLFVTFLNQIMNWIDTIMLGYFKTAYAVGLYNAALPISQFISIVLSSMLFVYMPTISELYAKNKIFEIKKSYVTLTKWLCAVTFPFVMILVFFPETIISILFGSKYVFANKALQILAIGFYINNLMGPNGATLTAFGETKFLMYATFMAAFINVCLNALLIPRYGITGAAFATITTLFLINLIRSIKLYQAVRIHSFEKKVIEPTILSGILISLIYIFSREALRILNIWMVVFLFILSIFVYGLTLVFSKCIDEEDIKMILLIKAKLNLKK